METLENNFKSLNGPFLIEYNQNNPEIIQIHLTPVLSSKDNPAELRTIFTKGMQEVAKILKEDIKYKDVKKIEGVTEIGFTDNQKIIELFGFHEVEKFDDLKMHKVEISKEDLIKRYG